jgi:ABC-type transport system involved in multi-copper enzyme maturation permease subunit
MGAVLAIAKATYRESIRQRVLLVVLLLGFLLLGVAVAFSYLSTGEEFRFIVDFGLTGFILVGLGLSVILGAYMIPNEIDRRIVMTVLSKPVSRLTYLVGKVLGAALVIAVVDALMGVAFIAAYAWKHPQHLLLPVLSLLIATVVAVYLQTLILLGTAVLLSTFSSSAFTAIATGFVFVVGSIHQYVTKLSEQGDSTWLRFIFGVLALLIPNFQNFDLRQSLMTASPVSWGHIAGSVLGYTVLYLTAVLGAAWLMFSEREF